MLERIAGFIVDMRKPILAVALVLCALCAAAIPAVNINADMTKYLPDDSEMRAGMDLMETELPSVEMDQSIRVMFTGIDEDRARHIEDELDKLEYAKGVTFDWNDEDYHRDPYTLFVVGTEYDYDSPEEEALEKAILDAFPNDQVEVKNDNTNSAELALWVLVFAVLLLFTILFVMTPSWTEPLLFMVTIGIAVVYNLGTNIFFDSVSSTTFSIAAVLQLVLSMDYSIILMNRYRQERMRHPDPVYAMKRALAKAFPSIASSGITTFVGLTMLLFMTLKIGADMGRVLAKGVLFSMLCVFVILPGLILIANRLIERTGKRTPNIPTAGMARAGYRFRTPIAIAFACLFVGAFYLQTLTPIVFTAEGKDTIAEVFPRSNTMVMLYPSDKEEAASALVKDLEGNASVKDVSAYSNTLAKQRSAPDMQDAIEDASDSGGSSQLDTTMLQLLYYHAHKNGETPSITPGQFITFLGTDVLEEDSFSDQLDDKAREGIHDMQRFGSADKLREKMGIQELADFLEMNADDVRELLAYYFALHGGADAGTMSLSDFARFMNDDVLGNERYSSRIDAGYRDDIQRMIDLTDAEEMTRARSADDLASFLDMDAADCELLYLYYQVNEQGYQPNAMTMAEFAAFMNGPVLENDRFASQMDDEQKGQMAQLLPFTNGTTIGTQMGAQALADLFGMDEQQATQVLLACYYPDAAATIEAEARAAAESAAREEAAAIEAEATQAAQAAGAQAAADEQAQVQAAAEKASAEAAAQARAKPGATPESIREAAEEAGRAAAAEVAAAAESRIRNASEKAAQAAAAEASANAEQRARQAGEEAAARAQEEALSRLMAQAAGKTLSPHDFVGFLLSDDAYTQQMDATQVEQLRMLEQVMDATAAGAALSPADMAALMDMDADKATLLFAYHDLVNGWANWTMSVQDALNFLVHGDSPASDELSAAQQSDLAQACDLVDGAVAGTQYAPEDLARLLDLDPLDTRQMYYLNIAKHGDTSDWKVSVADFVAFLVDDVLANPDYADEVKADQADDLRSARKLVDAVVAERPLTTQEMAALLGEFDDGMDADSIYVLYLLYGGLREFDPTWTMSIEELFNHLNGTVLADPRFDKLIDAESRADIQQSQSDLDEARAKLRGPNYSLASISLHLPNESAETEAFLADLRTKAGSAFDGNYYLVGNTPMVYEMKAGFSSQMLLLILLTAASIFLVVLLSFRRIAVPLILVLLVQCGVYITIAASGLMGYSIYFQAMLVVQCILMGATIDYGILFTNYYREARTAMRREASLTAAYEGSIHTVLTSGLIMILVTGVIGMSGADPTVCQICQTISIGALSAVLLILFVLPGLLATFNRFVCSKNAI